MPGGCGGINKDSPLSVAKDELVDRLAAVNLALAGAQATKEGFQLIVGPVAFRPSVARKEPGPALPEGGAEMRDHGGFVGMVLGILFQAGQEVLDLTLNVAPRGAWLAIVKRVKPALHLDQPVPLALEMPLRRRKCAAAANHGQEVIQERMAPFFRLRVSEASRRVKSS